MVSSALNEIINLTRATLLDGRPAPVIHLLTSKRKSSVELDQETGTELEKLNDIASTGYAVARELDEDEDIIELIFVCDGQLRVKGSLGQQLVVIIHSHRIATHQDRTV